MKTMLWGIFRAAVIVCITSAVLFQNALALPFDDEPEKRTWKSKKGHEVVALLISYSELDVTLELANKTKKTIKLSLMSDEDVKYLKGFPKLKRDPDPKNLPRVEVGAKTKSLSRKGGSGGIVQRTRTMEINLDYRGDDKLEVVVLYGFVTPNPPVKGMKKKDQTLNDLYTMSFQTKNVTLDGKKPASFATDPILESHYEGGSKAPRNSFFTQVYWKGALLDGWAAESKLNSLTKDSSLLDRYFGRK